MHDLLLGSVPRCRDLIGSDSAQSAEGWKGSYHALKVMNLMQEPWLVALLTFEFVLFLVAIFLRKNTYVQTVLFFFCGEFCWHGSTLALIRNCRFHRATTIPCRWHAAVRSERLTPPPIPCNLICPPAAGTVRCAEMINSYLATRWTDFATQPYFDTRGVFVSAVMSAPLMLIMFVVLVRTSPAEAEPLPPLP